MATVAEARVTPNAARLVCRYAPLDEIVELVLGNQLGKVGIKAGMQGSEGRVVRAHAPLD